LTADISFYVVQSRNNQDFNCDQINPVSTSTFIGSEGGVVEGDAGVKLIIPAMTFSQPTSVSIQPDQEFELFMPAIPNIWFLGAVNLNLGANPAAGKFVDVSLPIPNNPWTQPLDPNDQFLVAQQVMVDDEIKYKLVDVASMVDGYISSQKCASIMECLQVITNGIYAFFTPLSSSDPDNAVGYVKGIVKDESGQPVPGAIISVNKLFIFTDQTDKNGKYLIPGIKGNVVITAIDPKTGKIGAAAAGIGSKDETITLDITLKLPDSPLNSNLINGSFEDGFAGWVTRGQATVVNNLGPINPVHGSKMAQISTGEGSIGDISSSIQQRFIIPNIATKISFDYEFVTDEYPEWVNTVYNDSFYVSVTVDGKTSQSDLVASVNDSQLHNIDNIPIYEGQPPESVGHTGWQTKTIPVSGDTQDILVLTITDLGDNIFDTIVLIDNVRFDNAQATKFLSFPVIGKSAYTFTVSSIMDHSAKPYVKDNKVISYDGEISTNLQSPTPIYGDYYGYGRPAVKKLTQIKYYSNTFLDYDGHAGYDYPYPASQPIYAPASGTMKIDPYYSNNTSGKAFYIDHTNSYMTKFLHTSLIPEKPDGANVNEGDLVAYSYLSHIHMEVWKDGQRVDPYGELSGSNIVNVLWK
jgi:murein DD-endopeptidase MepM/ murein hydrolase activator NlpD